MKRFLIYILALFAPLFVVAQQYHSLEIDASSLKPLQTDEITKVPIDPIPRDPSQRPCARIKMHINRMTAEDIRGISVRAVGGNVEVTKQVVAYEGNGLIIELTAKEQTRFYLHHDKYGDSNEVTLNLEGDREYSLKAQLCAMQSIVVSTNVVGADIFVDDVYKGKSDANYILTVNGLMFGNHKIRVEQGALKREMEVYVSDANIHFKVDVDTSSSRPQYVVFQVVPKDASVVIGDKGYTPDANGVAVLLLHNGSYNYSVSAKDYHDENGSVVVRGEKIVKSVTLRPAHGWLAISNSGALSDANVYVDGAFVGKTPIKSDKLASGTHKVRIVKNLYKTFEAQVTIRDGETLNYAPTLVADYATVTLKVGNDCDIYVNNEHKGKGSWQGNLATGAYIFEARKQGHTTTSLPKTITASPSQQSYTIPTPQPILGTLNVTSNPAMVDVYVDGKAVGQTPLMVDLIVGKHDVELRKSGFASAKQNVTINEGKTTDLNLTLSVQQTAQVSTTSSKENYIERTKKGLNMKMIYVEGGTFSMGSTDGDSDERPVHSVTLDSYYIAETEVTQAQWRAVMGTDPSNYKGDNRPVDNVSWDDAMEFCKKLSELTGKKYTLPTEAQWEYAARGGNKSKHYTYSGSNNIGDVAWYSNNSDQTLAVKSKQPNELGLYDMSGNVWEWCLDWYGSYSSSSQTNPTGPESVSFRVLRGGSWYGGASYCRVADRSFNDPSRRFNFYGFRVVCIP